jgi:hypothetical protein
LRLEEALSTRSERDVMTILRDARKCALLRMRIHPVARARTLMVRGARPSRGEAVANGAN